MSDQSFLDWPFLDETHRLVAAEAEEWAASNLRAVPHGETDVDAACKSLARRMGVSGLLRHCLPEEGQPEVRSLCLLREILARHEPLADFVFAMQGLGTGSIQFFGTEAQKAAFLPQVRNGTALAAFALSEPDAGSDVAAIAMTASRTNEGWRLDGVKTWISNGGIAAHYVVFARTGEAPGTRGLSAFIVPADTPGLTIAERIDIIAPHPLATLHFDNCVVPHDALLGAPGQGFKIAMATLDVFRPTVGAAALGMARRALDEAAWARDRDGGRITREAAMAKMVATESAQSVIDNAVQIFGGLGVTKGNIVEQLYRDVRALRIYEGATEVQQMIIGRAVLAE